MILPETASRTDGFCMRCEGKRKQVEREEYVRAHRREVDLYSDLSDPVEIIRVFHTWRKPDPLIRYKPSPWTAAELYSSLSSHDLDRVARLAMEGKRSGNKDLAEAVAKSLATLTNYDLSNLIEVWLDSDEFWPAVLFRGANAVVRDRVIGFLDRWQEGKNSSLEANHALSALAWIGDPTVQACFARWEGSPPPWRKQLYVGPGRYAHTGGWELDRSTRRNLVHRECVAIVPLPEVGADDPAVDTFVPASNSCPWCGRPLIKMLTIDTTDLRFSFLGWTNPRLEILTCGVCTCFSEAIFGRIESDGHSDWHPSNQRPKHLPKEEMEWDASPWQGVSVRLESRGPMQAVEPGIGNTASQIGGHPCWVQDTAYPNCPDCGRTMTFVAQLDNDDFKHQEGCYYAFLCAPCRVTATCYQQT